MHGNQRYEHYEGNIGLRRDGGTEYRALGPPRLNSTHPAIADSKHAFVFNTYVHGDPMECSVFVRFQCLSDIASCSSS